MKGLFAIFAVESTAGPVCRGRTLPRRRLCSCSRNAT